MREFGNNFKGFICGLLALLLIVPTVTGLNAGNVISGGISQAGESELNINEYNVLIAEPAIEPGASTYSSKGLNMISPISGSEISSINSKFRVFGNAQPLSSENYIYNAQPPTMNSNLEPDDIENSGESGTRSSSRQENYDLELRNIQWGVKNSGWCAQTDPDDTNLDSDELYYWYEGNQAYIGSFILGEATTITATVKNNGLVTVTNIIINFTIFDYITWVFEGKYKYGAKCPITIEIGSLNPQQTQQISAIWEPPFASEFAVIAEVESLDYEDPEPDNNRLAWLIRVLIWEDDIENDEGDWTHSSTVGGDYWHITDSPHNQQDDGHTQTHAWYHGENDAPGAVYPTDAYANNNTLTLTSPTIDMGDIITKITDEGGYYTDYFACYCCLLTGQSEVNDPSDPDPSESDVLWFREISDDGGATWQEMNTGYNIFGYFGNRFTVGSWGGILYVTNPVWNDEWFPAPGYATTDGQNVYYNPGAPMNENVTVWNNIKFRMTFESDDDNVQDIGFYLDDFITWGVQDFTVPFDVSLVEFTPPAVDGVPIVHPNENAIFTTSVKNKPGAASQAFNTVLTIKNLDTDEEEPPQHKSVTLGVEEEKSQQWSWTPEEAGDYLLTITAGDLSEDWYRLDNEEYRIVRVREPTTEILIVDDDNSDFTIREDGARWACDENGHWYIDVVGKMCKDLEEADAVYDVYTVGSNYTGPSKTVMEKYSLIIWLTGLEGKHDYNYWRPNYQSHPDDSDWNIALKPGDISELEKYLDLSCRNLWLISPGYIYEQYGTTPHTTGTSDFARHYLHIWTCEANAAEESGGIIITRGTPNPLDGVPGTIMEDEDGTVSYATYDDEPPRYFKDIGGIVEGVPAEAATAEIFYQNPEHTAYNAISFSGDASQQYKSIFFAFNYYLILDPLDRADLVEKGLAFFGLMGGVELEVVGESIKWVYPSNEVSFQLKAINIGKKTDTMTISAEIYSETTAPRNDWPTYKIEIGGEVEDTIQVPGTESAKNYFNDIYLIITAPEWDKSTANWKTEYSFEVTSESSNSGLTSSVAVKSIINLYSNITVWYTPRTYQEVAPGGSWECYVNLKNSTNGDADYGVALKLDGEGKELAHFAENSQKTLTTTLIPNTQRSVIVKINTGDHELAGYHNITVEVKGTTTQIVHDVSTIATKVKQYYEIGMNSTDVTRVTIDPNDAVGNSITESFDLKIQNYGNGYDNVQFTIESHDKYRVEVDWLKDIEIIYNDVKLETEFEEAECVLRTTDTVAVRPYDDGSDPEYGEEEVTVMLNFNTSIDHGEYRFNVIVESEAGLDDEEDSDNNNLTIIVKIIKPDLTFSPQDINYTPYDEYPDRTIDNYRFIDDVYNEPISWDDFEELYLITLDHRADRDESKGTYGKEMTFSIELVINNIGDSPANLEAVLQTIVINVTHEEEDEFGDYVMINDGTLYPVTPTEIEIQPGQNATITFESWSIKWIDPSKDTEVIYALKVTLDKEDFILEKDETNNVNSFELHVKHLKKPRGPPPKEPINFVRLTGICLLIFICLIIIFLTIVGGWAKYYDWKRHRKQSNK